MAVTFTHGTVGSGKTYLMVREAVDDLQDGYQLATINLFLNRAQVQSVLRSRGVNAYDANQAVDRIVTVWTSPHFRSLRDVKLKVDEAHFWWPQSQYRKLDLEDILTAAMSRKRRVDLHIISQLDRSVNQHVRDLAMDSWLARPLLVEPFFSGLKLASRLGRAMGWRRLDRPCAFFYSRITDAMGSTKSRKDGSLGADDKRLVFLNPDIAACYDTLQEVSSPILDEMRDQSRQAYLIAILKGETRPQAACPVCGGARSWKWVQYPREGPHGVVMQREPFDADVLRRNEWATAGESDCEHCDDGTGPRGYLYTDDHPDYAAAAELAETVSGLQRGSRRARPS